MTKPTFENGRIVPITSGRVKSSQGNWTPRTPDATEKTYRHIMHVGAANMQQTALAYRENIRSAAKAAIMRKVERRKRLREGQSVVSFDKS